MSHLSLVPPLPATTAAPAGAVPEQRAPWQDDTVVALSFFESASGLCLCRECTKSRHPAFGAR
ncbi:MAG TPA: hypothetical protein VFQ85_19545 [Mycobacteriales bacterium]|jgi:hypothetical protein|nr:hypothetical protein [Mycobacteriales bacterium]